MLVGGEVVDTVCWSEGGGSCERLAAFYEARLLELALVAHLYGSLTYRGLAGSIISN
jgi:hypothetical protein